MKTQLPKLIPAIAMVAALGAGGGRRDVSETLTRRGLQCTKRIVHGDDNATKKKKKAKKKKAAAKTSSKTSASTRSAPTLPRGNSSPIAPGSVSGEKPVSGEAAVEGITDPSQSGSHPAAGNAWGSTPPPAATQPTLSTGGSGTGGSSSGSGGGGGGAITVAPPASAEVGVTASAGSSHERAAPWIEGAVDFHLFHRSLGYGQNTTNNLPSYSLALGPAVGLELNAFPGGLVSDGPLGNIGVAAMYELAFGLVSSAAGGTIKYPTSANAFGVGLEYRQPVDPFRFMLRLGYGWRSFTISNASATQPKPAVPSVNYAGLIAELFARYKAGDHVAVDLQAGYHVLMGSGEIGSTAYFPKASGGGINALLGLSVLVRPMEVQLAFDIEHYFLSLSPQTGAVYAASSSADDFIGGRLTASFGLF